MLALDSLVGRSFRLFFIKLQCEEDYIGCNKKGNRSGLDLGTGHCVSHVDVVVGEGPYRHSYTQWGGGGGIEGQKTTCKTLK